MTNQEKLKICENCPHMNIDGTNSIFEEERNDMYCNLASSLIRGLLNSDCPEDRWNDVNTL